MIFGGRWGGERGSPGEVKFFGGDWGFLGKIYVGTPPPPAAVPLVLSGPLCPFGTSPHPVGSHPFQGRLLGMGKDLLLGSPLGELAP